MIQVRYFIQYVGQDADEHRLPAHEGARSLEGLTWAFNLITNYAASGRIQKRGSLDDRTRLYIAPTRQGSLVQQVIAIITEPNNVFLSSIVGSYAVSTVGNAFNSLVSQSFKRVCGLFRDEQTDETRRIRNLPSGDLEALVDAIEPSVERAHGVVGEGANRIMMKRDRTALFEMNQQTKLYVQQNIMSEDMIERDVTVGALNVNSGNGRVYLPELGKTVPFSIVKEPEAGTYEALSSGLNRYARGIPGLVTISCREILTADGRIKKLIIYSAN